MSRFDAIDLSQLPPPEFPEPLSFETIRADRLADLAARLDAVGVPYDAAQVESDPLVILQEADAYREVLVRQRIIDGVKAALVTTATGADLDNVVADFGLVRRVVSPADAANAIPAVMETDEALRRRRLIAVEALSTAGPEGAYIFHALSAHPQVGGVGVYGPEAEIADPDNPAQFLTGDGKVLVVILSNQGDGAPSGAVMDAVVARLHDKNIRPLNDLVIVRPATIVPYTIDVVIKVGVGPDPETIRVVAQARAEKLASALHAVGAPVHRAIVHAAATVFGDDGGPLVSEAALAHPAADIAANPLAAPYCTGVNVAIEVVGA